MSRRKNEKWTEEDEELERIVRVGEVKYCRRGGRLFRQFLGQYPVKLDELVDYFEIVNVGYEKLLEIECEIEKLAQTNRRLTPTQVRNRIRAKYSDRFQEFQLLVLIGRICEQVRLRGVRDTQFERSPQHPLTSEFPKIQAVVVAWEAFVSYERFMEDYVRLVLPKSRQHVLNCSNGTAGPEAQS